MKQSKNKNIKNFIKNEINLMKEIDHPNVLKCYDNFELEGI